MPDSTPRDLLTWKTGTIAAILLAGPVLAGRIYAHTVAPVTGLVAVVAFTFCVDRLEAKRRMRVGTIATILGTYTVAILWPWAGPGMSMEAKPLLSVVGAVLALVVAAAVLNAAQSWGGAALALLLGAATLTASVNVGAALSEHTIKLGVLTLVPLALVPFAIWCIGGGHDKRTVSKAKAYLPPVIAKNLPVGVTMDKPIVRGGKLSVILKRTPSAPAGALKDFDTKIASAIPGTKRGTVKMIDLGTEMGEGYYRLEVGESDTPFAQPLKPRPAVGEWPDGMVPIGEYGDGSVCYVGRWHTVIAAETRAGKSVLLENLIWGRLTQGDTRLVLLDPKVVEFATYQNIDGVTAYADTPETMTAELARLAERMESRYRSMKLKGIKVWTPDMGPFVCCVVDETFDLLATAPQAWPHLERLFQKAAAAGIQMICATQRPDAQSIPPLVKANAPTLIGLRVANATAERTLWEDAKERGVKLNDRKRPDGRAYVETVGRDGADVQIYRSPGTEGLALSAPSVHPINPTTSAGETPPDTPRTDTPRTDTPDTQRPQYDDRIADLLDMRPLSARAVANGIGCSPDTAAKALKRLADQGRAMWTDKGWIDPMFGPSELAD